MDTEGWENQGRRRLVGRGFPSPSNRKPKKSKVMGKGLPPFAKVKEANIHPRGQKENG